MMAEKVPLLSGTESGAPVQQMMDGYQLTRENLGLHIALFTNITADSTTLQMGTTSHSAKGLGNLNPRYFKESFSRTVEMGGPKDGLRYVFHSRRCCAECRSPNILVSVYDQDGNLQGQLADQDVGDYQCCSGKDVALMKVLNGKGEQTFALRRPATCQDMCHVIGHLHCRGIKFFAPCALLPPLICSIPNCKAWYDCCCPCTNCCPFDFCVLPILTCCECDLIFDCKPPQCQYCKACVLQWPCVCFTCDCARPDIPCPGVCCKTVRKDMVSGVWKTPVHQPAQDKAVVTGTYKALFPLAGILGLEGVEKVQVEFDKSVSNEDKVAFSTVMMWEAMSKYPDTFMNGQTRTASAVAGVRQTESVRSRAGQHYGAVAPPGKSEVPKTAMKAASAVPRTMTAAPAPRTMMAAPAPKHPPGLNFPPGLGVKLP